jgi:phosphoglycerate kinase
MAKVLTLDNINVDGKTVLVRVDINSPLDPSTKAFLDDTRIRAILPTINRLSKAKTVLIAHQSRPGKNDFTSTLGHARELGRLLGRSIKWVQDIHGEKAMKAIEEMSNGDILMLNNIRMDPEETSTKGDSLALAETKLVQDLASVADLFVNDAFACAHRNSPSIVGFAHHLPCVAGELMAHEIRQLDHALESPARPCIAVLGGIKVDDSIDVAMNMLNNTIADEVWLTGGVANLAIHLSGHDIGEGNVEFLKNELKDAWGPTVDAAKSLLATYSDNIILPSDVAANVEGNRIDLKVEELPIHAPLFDLGLQSIRALSLRIKESGTVILNGPAGVFELPDFALGTIEMLSACAETGGFALMGGGHTATLVSQRGMSNKMGHVSTGGGACLDYIAGRTLPGIHALEMSAQQYQLEITPVLHDE